MRRSYGEIVEILKVSLDRQDRAHRFETFREAVSSYKKMNPFSFPADGRGVILIAGTNGKGSVAKTLETLLLTKSSNVGLYTSPHLTQPTERIRSLGHDLQTQEMVEAYALIETTVDEFCLSHFEILTLMMIEIFFGGRVRPKVDFAIIEVGVGGRLDPTRLIPHETAVVTALGFDHEAILGSTLTAIAAEKLAIAEGTQRLIFLKPVSADVQTLFEKTAATSQALFIEARIFQSSVSTIDGEPRWSLQTPWGDAALSLLGERAVQNTSLALEVLDRLGFDVTELLPSVSQVSWPGRMERISLGDRQIYLSGDHNEQGVQSLTELLKHFDYERCWLVVGVGRGKSLDQIFRHYFAVARSSVVLTLTPFRPLTLEDLAPWRARAAALVADPFEALMFAVSTAGPHDLIVVSGSLYLVGDLRAKIHESN